MTGFVLYLLFPPTVSTGGFVLSFLVKPGRMTSRQNVQCGLLAWMLVAAFMTLAGVCAGRLWPVGAGTGASLAVAAVLWWWFFRGRGQSKRIGGLVGAKTRALRGRLVKRQRQAYRPPALQPT